MHLIALYFVLSCTRRLDDLACPTRADMGMTKEVRGRNILVTCMRTTSASYSNSLFSVSNSSINHLQRVASMLHRRSGWTVSQPFPYARNTAGTMFRG